MPRASIEYMNARKAVKAASGGTNYAVETDQERKWRIADERKRDRETERDPADLAISQINDFAIWAECSRARYLAANGQTIADVDAAQYVDEIPF